jgi:hypothetical protein
MRLHHTHRVRPPHGAADSGPSRVPLYYDPRGGSRFRVLGFWGEPLRVATGTALVCWYESNPISIMVCSGVLAFYDRHVPAWCTENLFSHKCEPIYVPWMELFDGWNTQMPYENCDPCQDKGMTHTQLWNYTPVHSQRGMKLHYSLNGLKNELILGSTCFKVESWSQFIHSK